MSRLSLFRPGLLALASLSFAPALYAQTPASPAMPPGHPPIGAATAPTTNAPPETAAPRALPPGHPPIPSSAMAPAAAAAPAADAPEATPDGQPAPGADGQPAAPDANRAPPIRQMQLPESIAEEAIDLPQGVILVRIVDATGQPVPNVPVRIGMMREGEQQRALEAQTRADGVAQFDHLETGSHVAYRASTDLDGARFGATPFNLPTNVGYRVQLVRFPVVHEPRAVLVQEARVEVSFVDDRLLVAEHISIVNFSNMSLNGSPPQPQAFVPTNGLRFGLPAGQTAFRDDPSMGDQHITEEGNSAVLRGSIPPTGANETIDLAFQYRVRFDDTNAAFDVTLPLPVLRVVVGSQAAQGMRLVVEGMPPAEERTFNGQRMLVTGRERASREDTGLDRIQIRLENIPSPAGPERSAAALTALALALGSVAYGVRGGRDKRRGTPARPMPVLESERSRLLETAATLARDHAAGDIGPETFGRRQRELSIALASVLKEIASAKSKPAAERKRAKGAKAS